MIFIRSKLQYALLLFVFLSACAATKSELKTVDRVDVPRYLGHWYEIAHNPMFFQRQCLSSTQADYQARADGQVDVVNRCKTDHGWEKVHGRAFVVSGSEGARLRVTFFWPFYGNYWIIGLGPDYRWALVGEPSRNYLWLLARTPHLPDSDVQQALAIARSQGYDLSQLEFTPP